jgi:CDP-glycerol glycerophosphotransferase
MKKQSFLLLDGRGIPALRSHIPLIRAMKNIRTINSSGALRSLKICFSAKESEHSIVCRKGAEFEKSLAKAGYWIFNYRAPDHVFPKKNQTFLQCWHGTPLKRLGYDLKSTRNATNSQKEIYSKYKTDAKKFKYLLSPSPFASEKFISAWNLHKIGKENCIMEVGYPRNDFLFTFSDRDVQRIKENLGLEAGKK